ncbi:MAG TPA: YciI family protein [bacterium]|nr:YciI family protein [bacterium]
MKYLCLIYNEETKLAAMSTVEREAMVDEGLAYDEELKQRGHFIAAEALQRSGAATTVRVRNGRLSTTTGPVVDLKEQLAGFILIDARDLNEAIQVASKMPGARVGSIEVRPIREPDPTDRALC